MPHLKIFIKPTKVTLIVFSVLVLISLSPYIYGWISGQFSISDPGITLGDALSAVFLFTVVVPFIALRSIGLVPGHAGDFFVLPILGSTDFFIVILFDALVLYALASGVSMLWHWLRPSRKPSLPISSPYE